jgi:GNAT superfamily N-acetyltransferase
MTPRPLSGGCLLNTRHLVPPVGGDEAREVAAFVAKKLSEPFLCDLLTGDIRTNCDVSMMVGDVDGQLVGSAFSVGGGNTAGMAVMGGVLTDDAYLRQGIATDLCRDLCEVFDTSGGRFFWLAAKTPAAQRIYERLGFSTITGQLMCRSAGGADPFSGFMHGGTTTRSVADWDCLPLLVPLYAWPHDCKLLDADLDIASTRIGHASRCLGLFWNTWRTTLADGGRWEILQNQAGWVVASAVARQYDSLLHGDHWRVDFVWHPRYEKDGIAFVGEFISDLETKTGLNVSMRIAEGDEVKLGHAVELGFTSPKMTADTVIINGRTIRLSGLARKAN